MCHYCNPLLCPPSSRRVYPRKGSINPPVPWCIFCSIYDTSDYCFPRGEKRRETNNRTTQKYVGENNKQDTHQHMRNNFKGAGSRSEREQRAKVKDDGKKYITAQIKRLDEDPGTAVGPLGSSPRAPHPTPMDPRWITVIMRNGNACAADAIHMSQGL